MTEKNNTYAKKHGAEGTLKRVINNLPLAINDQKRRDEIVTLLGYDVLPAGALGFLVEAIADNVLIAERFREARVWAVENGSIEDYERLSQRSGWRNDKIISQLPVLVELQKDDSLDYESILRAENGTD